LARTCHSPVSGGSREIVKPSWGYRIVTDDLARQRDYCRAVNS
jgi:hypothetical protein